MNEAPLSFIKQIEDHLIEMQAIPLWGSPPPFPWQELSSEIGTLLHTPDLEIRARKVELLSAEEITSGFGSHPIPLLLELTPLHGHLFWLMGKEEVAKLTALALSTNGGKGFSSPHFQEGFYYFLALQVLEKIDGLKAFKDLGIKMGKFSALPAEKAICIDVEIRHPKATLWGRVICPLSFHKAFESHFSEQRPSLQTALTKQIDLKLQLEIGQTSLPLSKWEQLGVGDLLLLDRCTFDPKSHKGTVTLTLGQTPLLRARVKENGLKIVDYAFYHEEQNPMDSKIPNGDEHLFDDNLPSESEETPLWASQDQDGRNVEELISPQEVPLLLTVEVGKLQINLDKLLELSPGNVLELPVRPEQGVNLTLNGKKVARGELIKLGEMIGVKILQLGE